MPATSFHPVKVASVIALGRLPWSQEIAETAGSPRRGTAGQPVPPARPRVL